MQESLDRNTVIKMHQLEVENSELQNNLVRFETLLLTDGTNKMWQDSISYFRQNYKKFIQQLDALNSKNEKALSLYDISEVQKNLDRETVLLSYYLGKRTYYIFAIDEDEFMVQALSQDTVIDFAKKAKIQNIYKKTSALKKIGKTGLGVYSSLQNILKTKLTLNQCVDNYCLLYTSPSPRDATLSRMPSSA